MQWELGALKMLARKSTVPGVALADAISEIERLRLVLKSIQEMAIYDIRHDFVETNGSTYQIEADARAALKES